MPNINTMKESKFLKKEDCGAGILVTIKEIMQENVAKVGAPEEMKWCMVFAETELPMVANTTNLQLCAQICGSQETDDWIGKKVVLYHDPAVSYAGKVTGGIRIRAPRTGAAPAASAHGMLGKPAIRPAVPAPSPEPDPSDEQVPF